MIQNFLVQFFKSQVCSEGNSNNVFIKRRKLPISVLSGAVYRF